MTTSPTPTPTTPAAPDPRRTRVRQVLAGVAGALLLVQAPFFLAAGLVAPRWAVLVLCALWLGLLGLAIAWFRRHPLRVLPLPLVSVAVWVGGVSLGGWLLGWTA